MRPIKAKNSDHFLDEAAARQGWPSSPGGCSIGALARLWQRGFSGLLRLSARVASWTGFIQWASAPPRTETLVRSTGTVGRSTPRSRIEISVPTPPGGLGGLWKISGFVFSFSTIAISALQRACPRPQIGMRVKAPPGVGVCVPRTRFTNYFLGEPRSPRRPRR